MTAQLLNNLPAQSTNPVDSLIPFQKATNKKINLVPNVSTVVAPLNLLRINLIVVSLSDQPVWVSLGDAQAVVGVGLPLYSRGSYIQIDRTMLFRGQITAISEIASAVSIVECIL